MFQVLCLLLLFGIWYRLQYDNHNSRPNGNHEYIDSSFHNSNMKEGEDAGSASIPRAYARGFESAVKLARAYIRQKYPLTGRGMELQNQTKDALCQNDLARLDQFAQYCLPTVEEPKLEL